MKNFTAGHVRQGASTITQQLARNSFSLKEKTFRRKLLEIFLARRIEESFGKQKIMELYLNRIYFGGGLYGAEAAARGYFAKPARELSLAECATLAGLIKSPNRLSPWSDKAASREARNYALGRMRDLGFIDRQKCASAQAEDVVIGSRQNAQGQTYAVDYIRQQVIAAVGWDRAMNEGFRIHTTIDADLQKVAEDSLRKSLDQAEQHPGYNHQTYADYAANFKKAKSSNTMSSQPAPEYLQGAVIALDNQTGGILVLVGGRDFEHNQYDRALQAKRPAGTAMKPFVYAAAFENGMYPGSVVEDSALDNRAVMIGGTTGILGEWGPESEENRYEGAMTARQALAKSKNGATVRIGMDAGLDEVLQLCRTAGIRSPLRPYPATFLGSSEDHARRARARLHDFSERRLASERAPHSGAHRRKGRHRRLARTTRAGQPAKRHQTGDRLRSSFLPGRCARIRHGKSRAHAIRLEENSRPRAKTGTAYDFTDALFAGYDSAITCAVWAGFDKPQKIYRGAFGREIALPVWVDIMNASVARYPPKEIAQPATLKKFEICSRSGLLATDKCYDTVKGASGDPCNAAPLTWKLGRPRKCRAIPATFMVNRARRLVRDLPESEFPRAQSAVDLNELQPVIVKSPTLLADKDPYNSAKPTFKPTPEATPEPQPQVVERKIDNGTVGVRPIAQPPQPNAPIMKALPVQPSDEKPMEIRKAEPVGPLDEADDETCCSSRPLPLRLTSTSNRWRSRMQTISS